MEEALKHKLSRYNLKDAISILIERLDRFDLSRPEIARNRCGITSVFIKKFLVELGFNAKINEAFFGARGHYFVTVDIDENEDLKVIDFTARQFLPMSVFPIFTDWSTAPRFLARGRTLEDNEELAMINEVVSSDDYKTFLLGL